MVWWALPRQVWEAIPRGAWQSHSSISTTDSIWRALSICSVILFGLTGSPCLWRSFWTGCRCYGKDWSKGSFWLWTKASSPSPGNTSQSIQVSLCLPNQRDLDTWYEAVFALPLAWPDITDIDPHYLKKTSAHQLLSIRMQMGVSHMWGGLSPQWHLLKHHLWNLGPGCLAGRLEELLILNRPCRPGEDVHDSVLPTSYWQAWKTWEHTKKRDWSQSYQCGGYLVCRWGRSGAAHLGDHQ